MKPKLLSCLAIGTLLAVTFAIVILITPYGKSLSGNHISPHRAFDESHATDTTLRGIYIPPPEHQKLRVNPDNNITTTTVTETVVYPTSNNSVQHTPYMLALHTAEQLTMSTSHFVEFMNLVHQWNMTGVEPVVYGSRMNGLRSMHAENIPGSVHYHTILNTSLMRERLSKCLLTGRTNVSQESNTSQLFVPLKVFLRQSMRKIALVYFSRHMSVLGKQLHAAADALLNKNSKSDIPVAECTGILRESGISGQVENLLNRELIIEGANTIENFTVVQAFCVRKVEISLLKLKDEVLTLIHRDRFNQIDASIIFVSWQGKFTRKFTDVNTLYRCRLPSSQIEPSQQVMATSDQFLKSLGLKKRSYISIHIRFEKLFRVAFGPRKDSRRFLNCCMLKLNALLKQVKKLNNLTSEGSTLLLHDYGSYGTDACQHKGGWRSRLVCVNDSQHLLSLLNESRVSEFDPVKFDAPQNSGFVSLVEGVSLAGGHSLIVLGGGSFQVSIVGRYTDRLKREHAKSGAVYSICTARDNVHNLELGEIKECL
jgi:hypothetical protein